MGIRGLVGVWSEMRRLGDNVDWWGLAGGRNRGARRGRDYDDVNDSELHL
jgi:hypothetical protein